MDGDQQRLWWRFNLSKLSVYLLIFVLLGVGYSYPELAPTLVVIVVALVVLGLVLGLRHMRR